METGDQLPRGFFGTKAGGRVKGCAGTATIFPVANTVTFGVAGASGAAVAVDFFIFTMLGRPKGKTIARAGTFLKPWEAWASMEKFLDRHLARLSKGNSSASRAHAGDFHFRWS